MKHLLVLCCICSMYCNAQEKSFPDLENFTIGSKSIYLKLPQQSVIEAGARGQNAIWDFSSLKVESKDTLTQEIVKVKDTPYASDYPKANLAEKNSDGSWVFIEKDKDMSKVWGIITTQGIKMSNTTPYIFLKRPIKYNDSISGKSEREYSVKGQSIKGTNNYYTVVDGMGTLKLAAKTYKDVVRIKFVQSFEDGAGDNLTKIFVTSYAWFDRSHKAAILKIDHVKVSNKWYNNENNDVEVLLDEKVVY